MRIQSLHWIELYTESIRVIFCVIDLGIIHKNRIFFFENLRFHDKIIYKTAEKLRSNKDF